ncbi:hypothetical protein H8959_017145 [Pygathrix nigripes]
MLEVSHPHRGKLTLGHAAPQACGNLLLAARYVTQSSRITLYGPQIHISGRDCWLCCSLVGQPVQQRTPRCQFVGSGQDEALGPVICSRLSLDLLDPASWSPAGKILTLSLRDPSGRPLAREDSSTGPSMGSFKGGQALDVCIWHKPQTNVEINKTRVLEEKILTSDFLVLI